MRIGQKIALFVLLGVPLPLTYADDNVPDLSASARMIAQKFMLVDTHIDVPYRIHDEWADVTRRTADGNFDYERARRGGLDIPFMSIFTPAESEADGTSFTLANQLIDSVEAMAGRAPKKIVVVKTSRQAEKARELGLMGLAMGLENGSPIEGKLENLAFFKDRGISYITLAHALSNHISDSSYDEERKWNGLSPFGREVVAEMNRLGIMIDVSHITDEAFYQVLEVSKVPVIASHSSLRRFTPGWERNMSDEMIKALAANGGVIQVNFGSSFINEEARKWFDDLRAAREAFVAGNGNEEHKPDVGGFMRNFRQQNPFPFASMDDLVTQYKYIIELVGVEHVGIGSDFDGVGDSLPEGMKDVSQYPNLIREFLKMELSLEDIERIMGGNLMRVWRAADDYADQVASG